MDEKSEPAQPNERPPFEPSEDAGDCSDNPLKDPGAQVLRSAGASLEAELIAMGVPAWIGKTREILLGVAR